MTFKRPNKHQKKKLEKLLGRDEEAIVVTTIGNRYFWLNVALLFPLALIFIGIPKLAQIVRMRQSYQYILTTRRFLIIRGIFSRKIVTAPLSAITHVTIEQSFAQRYFYNTGHLVVITAGFDQREIVIEHVGNPVEFKVLIEELTDKLDRDDDDAPQLRSLPA